MTTMRSEVYNIDCMEFMKTLPDKCFDLCIADPPFAVKYARGKNGFGVTTKNLPTPQDLKWDSKIPDKEFFDELLRVSDRVIIWGGAILYTSVAAIEMLARMGQVQRHRKQISVCRL